MFHRDVIVIGLGGLGSAALYHLARRGLRPLGVDARLPPTPSGCSYGGTRIFRKAYFNSSAYIPLGHRSQALFAGFESDHGVALLDRRGAMMLGPAGHPVVAGVRRSVAEHRLPHRVLEGPELAALAPLRAREGEVAIVEQDAGIIASERCVIAHLDEARKLGAEVRAATPVLGLSRRAGHLCIELPDGPVTAGAVVLAAGPWLAPPDPGPLDAGRLAGRPEAARSDAARSPGRLAERPVVDGFGLRLALTIQRQVQLWFEPRDPAAVVAMPCSLAEATGAYYVVPERGLLKACRHQGGGRGPLSSLDRSLRPADEDDVRAVLRARLPGADGPLRRWHVSAYVDTPDGHFLVGPHPTQPDLVLLGGCSGHAFKFAPALGEAAAALAVGERPAVPLDLFSPARFA